VRGSAESHLAGPLREPLSDAILRIVAGQGSSLVNYRAFIAVIAAAFLFLSTNRIACSAPAESDTPLDDIVVVADRAPEPLSRIGNSVTVLDENVIRDSQAVVVSDLLAQTPGVTFVRNGGVGAMTSVYIRGAESDQTVVVLDGVVLNDPSLPGGGFDFAHLLTGDISRIEILRGAQSTLYGSQAIGGIVNIITAEPTAPFGGSITAEGGSHDTGYISSALGGKNDALLWRLAGNYYSTSGIPDFDAALGGKRLCASQIGNGSGQLRYDLAPDSQLDLRGYYALARTDFDGYDTPPNFNFGDDNEYGKTRQFLGYAGITVRSPERELTNRFAIQYTDSVTRNYDPNAPTDGFGVSASTETFYGIGRNIREEYQGNWNFSPVSRLVFGAQHERSTINTDSPAFDVTPMPLDNQVSIDSGYAQLQSEVLAGLTLTAGGRYDHHDVYGGHTTAQFAAAWALDDRQTILRGSFGQGFKAPSLYQLYSNYGNLALQPEQASSWDAGVEHHTFDGHAVVSATYFQRYSRDLINFFSCPAANALCVTEPGGFYANIARASARGLELQGTLEAGERLNLSVNYTLTESEDRSQGSPTYGQELPNRPKNSANVTATYRWPSRLSAMIALRYAGPSLDETITPTWLGGYALLDLRLSYPIRDRFEIYGRVENATGKHYETTYEYGTLGRVGYLGIRSTF
jgi:vitamin B12 transporter